MNHHGKTNKSRFNTKKKQRQGLNRYNVLRDRWRSLVCQTTQLEIEAKEDNQLSELHGIFVAKLVKMKREQIQERAFIFISNDFTSTLETLLILNNGAAIHISKMKLMASEVSKKLNNLSHFYIQDLVKKFHTIMIS